MTEKDRAIWGEGERGLERHGVGRSEETLRDWRRVDFKAQSWVGHGGFWNKGDSGVAWMSQPLNSFKSDCE